MVVRDDVRLFADVRGALAKLDQQGAPGSRGADGQVAIDTAIAQLVSGAVSGDEIIDVYASAGLEKPDLSILSDEFLERITA